MSHTVIQFDSHVSTETKASNLKSTIRDKIDSAGYSLSDQQVNDGEDLEGNATLRVTCEHDNTTEANNFYDYLWKLAQDNKAENGDEGFMYARIQVHDCKHLAGLDEPCEIGNADKYDLR